MSDRILLALRRIERELTELSNDLHYDRDPETRELARAADAAVAAARSRRARVVEKRDEEDEREDNAELEHLRDLDRERGRQP